MGGTDWLLDCARPFDYFARVRPCLEARAVRRLDGLLLTQDDVDHAGAAAFCREDYRPARMVLSATNPRSREMRDLRQQLADEHAPVRLARRGDTVPLTLDVKARVLYPPESVGGKGGAADRALALRFDAAGWRVWWLAEGDGAAVHWLLAHEGPDTLTGDVLVTTAPVSAEWLRAMNPRLLIVRPPDSHREKKGEGAPLPPDKTFVQENTGAVTLEVYPESLDARGFVDGRKITVRK